VSNHVKFVQVRYMDFVILGEDALLEDRNINVNNSAVVFKNNRVRAADIVSLSCGQCKVLFKPALLLCR